MQMLTNSTDGEDGTGDTKIDPIPNSFELRDSALATQFMDHVNQIVGINGENFRDKLIDNQEKIANEIIHHCIIFPFQQFAPEIADLLDRRLKSDPKLAVQLQLPALRDMFITLTEEIWKIPEKGEEVMRNLYPMLATSMMWYVWEIGSDNLAVMNNDGYQFKIGDVIKEYNDISVALAKSEITLKEALEKIDELQSLDNLGLETTEKVRSTFFPKGIIGEIIKILPRHFQNDLAQLKYSKWSTGSKVFLKDIDKGLLKANLISYNIALSGLNYAINSISERHGDKSVKIFDQQSFWAYHWAYQYSMRRYSEMTTLINKPDADLNTSLDLGVDTILLPYSYFSLLLFLSAADENLANFINSNDSIGLQENYANYIKTVTQTVKAVPDKLEEKVQKNTTLDFVSEDKRSNREVLTEMVMQIAKIGRIGNDAIIAMTNDESLAELIYIITEPRYSDLGHREALLKYDEESKTRKDLRPLSQIESMIAKDVLEREYSSQLNAGIDSEMSPEEKRDKFIENLGRTQMIYRDIVASFENNLRLISLRSKRYEGTVIGSAFSHFINWMLWERYSKGGDFDYAVPKGVES